MNALQLPPDLSRPALYALAMRAVCSCTSVLPDAILSRGRKREVCEARHLLATLLHDCGVNYCAIGRYLNGRAHSSVMHMVSTCNGLAEIDKNFVHLREQTRAVLVSHIINRN